MNGFSMSGSPTYCGFVESAIANWMRVSTCKHLISVGRAFMTMTQLAELILTRMYDRAQTQGYEEHFDVRAIAQELGEIDYTKVYRASQVLEQDGLIRADYDVGNGVHAFLAGRGAIAVEHGGHTGILPQFRRNPQRFLTPIVDQRVQNINYGSVTGQHVNFVARIESQSFDAAVG
jgi:hypothetical protein